MVTAARKKQCDRCGSCCLQGGPALHSGDLDLLRNGHLALSDLVTIRRGELALQPMAESPAPVESEFLKVAGRDGSWACRFYDEPGRACTIYGNRPLACGLFDCTAPEAVLGITGRDLLTRFSCAGHDDPMAAVAIRHDKEFPCPDLARLAARLDESRYREAVLAELTPLVNRELAFRSRIAREFDLSLGLELFWLGRPVFQLLLPLGVQVRPEASGLVLS